MRFDRGGENVFGATMPSTTQHRKTWQDLETVRDIQIERDLALYRAGKNPLCDGDESIKQARRVILGKLPLF